MNNEFTEWLGGVEWWLQDRASMSPDDIFDYDFEGAFYSGHSQQRAAIEALFDVDLDNEI